MNDNSVELVGYYGSDETHALSAWTSTSREINDDKRGRIDKLLTMLATEGHHTPFEKSSLHFLVTTDIASHIHLLKHRIGVNINAESARYKEFTIDKFYIPYDWPENQKLELEAHIKNSFARYHNCIDELVKNLLGFIYHMASKLLAILCSTGGLSHIFRSLETILTHK